MTGGISAAELYGGQAAGQAPAPMVGGQTVRHVVPRGTSPDPLRGPFVARAVLIDNPSGVWYLVNGRRIPPWTIGAIMRLDIPAEALDVSVDTPPGQLSENAGDDLVLVATDEQLPPHPGLFTPPGVAVGYTRTAVGVVVDHLGAGADTLVLPGVATERAVVLRVQATADPRTFAKGAGWGSIDVYYLPGPEIVAELVFTPEAGGPPAIEYAPGAVVVPAGVELRASGLGLAVSGRFDVRLLVDWYAVLP